MDKYANQGDVGGMGITALGALFPPVKAAGAVGRGLLRHLSPTGIVANATDSLIELPKDKQSEWDEMRHAQRVDQAAQEDAEYQSWLRTRARMDGVRG